MDRLTVKNVTSKLLIVIAMAALLVGAGPFSSVKVFAADLTPRSMTISDNVASAVAVRYDLQFTYATTGSVGSLLIQFCEEGPLPLTPCTSPAGFDASGIFLSSQSGETGFTIYSGSTANEIILTRPPSAANAGTVATYRFDNVTNPDNDGPVYVRLLTFASSDATGPAIDTGGLVLAINPQANVTAEVPPFLEFCIGESIAGFSCSTATEPFSDVGTLGPLVTGAAQTQMLAATNGDGGYSLWVIGGTMTSGNNTLPAMAGGPSQQGVSQFGINLRANNAPIVGQEVTGPGSATVDPAYAQQNQFRYQSGDTLATVGDPDDFRKYTVSYIVNAAAGQPGGGLCNDVNLHMFR